MRKSKSPPVEPPQPKGKTAFVTGNTVAVIGKPAKRQKPPASDQEAVDRHIRQLAYEVHLEMVKANRMDDPKPPLINILIPQIMDAIEPIAKEHYNEQGGFNFRMIDEMTAPLNKILSSKGVYIVPVNVELVSTVEKQAMTEGGRPYVLFYSTVKVWYEFRASDGSFQPAVALGKGMSDLHFDIAAAQTMAYKQVIWQTFMIPVLGKIDPEMGGQRAESVPTTPAPQTQPSSVPTPQPSLFGEPLATATGLGEPSAPEVGPTKRKRKADDAERATDVPMSAGTLNIVHTHLVQSGRPVEALLEHFKIQVLEDLKQSQMAEVLAWINGGEA